MVILLNFHNIIVIVYQDTYNIIMYHSPWWAPAPVISKTQNFQHNKLGMETSYQ